jgi:type II secretory pathway component GspD/PulD (secretin)
MKYVLAAALILGTAAFAQAQTIRAMDFRNQDIVDILLVLAEASGTSIIPDETVSGAASFHFTDSDLMDALDAFLSAYKLYQRREGIGIRVSRIDALWDTERGVISIRAEEVGVESLVRAAGRAAGWTILHDPLPRIALSLDIRELPLREALEVMLAALPGFTLEEGAAHIYLRKNVVPANAAGAAASGPPEPPPALIDRDGERYAAHIDQGRFLAALRELFEKGEREYSILTRTDAILENLYFQDRDFDALLRLILEQGNADYVLNNGVYYIIELQKRDVVKKLRETRVITLRHIAAQEFPALLPGELAGGNLIKVDKNTNTIILTGTGEEINPIAEFAALLDRPREGFPYRRFDLTFISAAELLAVLPPHFAALGPAAVPGGRAVIVRGPEESLDALAEYITRTDQGEAGYPVRLRYISIEDLFKSIPPSIGKDDIYDSGYPNLIFFKGPEEKRALFLRELELVDRPRPQLRYELLVIEYTKSRETGINRGATGTLRDGETAAATGGETAAGRVSSLIGNLSNILSLNFDVVSQFGYQFALNLSAQLAENTAQVYADTTMNGLSGQEIRFQNTDTYRYQEFEVDPDTGSLIRSGITREISSGLIVSLSGWVSGDDMITIAVNATVSKQNRNPAGESAGIPSTSERIVTTRIRTPSGTPIVLSGLIKEDSSRTARKIPILGSIPLIKHFFGDQNDTRERTEIVIYIVPYLLNDETVGGDIPRRLEQYYRRFFGTSQASGEFR